MLDSGFIQPLMCKNFITKGGKLSGLIEFDASWADHFPV